MGGSSQITGWNYRLAWLHMLGMGPWDTFREFRGADKVIWKGRITGNTALMLSAPKLWGGDKDQGGVDGTLRLMFGEAGQLPNAYCTATWGPKTAAYRGFMTAAWEGGIWGANNPWAQKCSYRGERYVKGWDDDDCWYPETCPVPIADASTAITVIDPNVELSSENTSPTGADGGFDFTVPAGALIIVEPGPGSPAWSFTPSDDYQSHLYEGRTWWNHFGIYNQDTPSVGGGTFWSERYTTAAEAAAANAGRKALIPAYAGGPYRLYLPDAEVDDNRGIGSFKVSYSMPGSRLAKNPAHMILERHTQQHAGRQPRSSVNLDHLTVAADWFFSRGFGLCTTRNPKNESPREFIKRIEKVAGCSFTKSLDDGLWYLDIANGVYDLDDLEIINDDHVLKFKETAPVPDNAVNSVSVKYFDPERKETVITPPVRAMGLIAQFGEIHQTFEYPEVPIGRIALEIATRELLARITPTRTFELDCNPGIYRLRKNQYVRLQLPKRGIADMVCLVGEIPTSGKLKSGAFQITLTQDIYSLPTTEYVVELGEDTRPPTEAAPIVHQRVFEAGYIDVVANMPAADFAALPADASYLVGTAVNPGRMRNFTMTVAPDGGDYDDVGDGEFCPSCTSAGLVEPGLQEGIGFNDPVMMASVQVHDLGLWDNELVRVDAIDLDAGTLDLGRGCGHTLPEQHAAGSRIYFYQHSAAYDPTQHIAGQTLNAKLLTNSFSEQLDPADATAVDVTVEGLLACPYPPGDYRINGVSIYAVGSATPGGGVGGGTGSGSVPTTPPAYTPDGTPSSPSTGPNGGYPDSGPYPVPPVPDYGDDLIPTVGDFDSASDLNAWRLFGGDALPAEWSISGGYLRYYGAGDTAAYCYPARFSLPLDEIRYSAVVRATVQSEPGLPIAVGYAMGFSSSSGGLPLQRNHTPLRDYPVETTIEYATVISAGSGLSIINLLPILVVGASDVGIANARFTNVEFIVEPVDVPATTQVLDHLAFDSGLTGWTRIPALDPGDATIGTAGGVLSFEPEAANGTYTHFVCDDPIDLADEIGKVIKISGEVWSNDPTVFAGRTVNGVALGVTSKVGGVYNYNPKLATGYLRGDFTLRRTVSRINTLDPGMTWHLVVSMRAALGYRAKVRNLAVAVTDAVVD